MDGLAGLMDVGFGSTDEKWKIQKKGLVLGICRIIIINTDGPIGSMQSLVMLGEMKHSLQA